VHNRAHLRTGLPREDGWVKSGQRGLDDVWRWENVDHCEEKVHIFQVLEVRCDVDLGDIVTHKGISYEICHVWHARKVGDGNSILIFAHPKAQSLTEEEWNELYGPMDLASGS